MKTLIRADSSSTIGLGHVMRDLVLAKSLEGEVFFACQNLEGNIIDAIPYEVNILKTNEADELIALIQSLHVKLLIIDHYGIDAFFERKIKEATGVQILSFDDTYEPHHCDILLNSNLSADASRYKDLVLSHCELRCGTPLIRDEFINEKAITRKKIYAVCVAMGGSDASNVTCKILDALPSSLHVSVLTTSANANLHELQNYATAHPNIALHVNTKDVATILNQSHFAIVTPSVMVHEVLFMDVPFIAIKVASNQDDMYQYLKKKNYQTYDYLTNGLQKIVIY